MPPAVHASSRPPSPGFKLFQFNVVGAQGILFEVRPRPQTGADLLPRPSSGCPAGAWLRRPQRTCSCASPAAWTPGPSRWCLPHVADTARERRPSSSASFFGFDDRPASPICWSGLHICLCLSVSASHCLSVSSN